ncbi:MAG: hypothetical protein BJ554DRAFT_3753 [Olpidium bornovanus]|uniref:Uncharacterized protein n=1 Tax=Olpidium bornovanus TaxID=278681 RepID=A0A8H8A2L2_9FUNG|nr:MAG: hypothetical protein BJ554DRAFT_3753 [Olpidium bornovanus]
MENLSSIWKVVCHDVSGSTLKIPSGSDVGSRAAPFSTRRLPQVDVPPLRLGAVAGDGRDRGAGHFRGRERGAEQAVPAAAFLRRRVPRRPERAGRPEGALPKAPDAENQVRPIHGHPRPPDVRHHGAVPQRRPGRFPERRARHAPGGAVLGHASQAKEHRGGESTAEGQLTPKQRCAISQLRHLFFPLQ